MPKNAKEAPVVRSSDPLCDVDNIVDTEARLREFVRFATLAPSSHNTQCWKFRLNSNNNTITILPDFERRCPRVDPDDHHLFATLGCALENIVIAAKARGWAAQVNSTVPTEGIQINFNPCEKDVSPLFAAIPKRQCTRNDYDGEPISQKETDLLRNAGNGDGVKVLLLSDKQAVEEVLKIIIAANTAQLDSPTFVGELKEWIRFSTSEATSPGDGLYGKCMGSPSAPRWIGSVIFDYMLRSSTENAKITRQVHSSSGLAVFVSEKDDPTHWVEAGRCYEQFALQATALGIKNAFLNMPVEEAEFRPVLCDLLGCKKGSRPDFIVRYGRAPEMPQSFRRPLEAVLEVES